MKYIILLLVGVTLLAETGSKFEVKEIDPLTVTALREAEAKLEFATEILKRAQHGVDEAKTVRDALITSVTSANGAFEGNCAYVSLNGMRNYRKVEIRGKYALITDGTEACSYVTFTNISNGNLLSTEGWR